LFCGWLVWVWCFGLAGIQQVPDEFIEAGQIACGICLSVRQSAPGQSETSESKG
jgi:hypothetical protein